PRSRRSFSASTRTPDTSPPGCAPTWCGWTRDSACAAPGLVGSGADRGPGRAGLGAKLPFALAGEWGLGCLMAEQDQERFVSPFGRPESLLLASPKRSNQEKGDPTSAPTFLRNAGSLRCSESVGRRELAHPCARTCAPFPAGFLRYSALHTGPRAERAPRPESIRPRRSLVAR